MSGMPDSVELELREAIDALWIVDTHEHLPPESVRLGYAPDPIATFFSHYASCDLVSAGLPAEDLERARNLAVPLVERWALIEPFWKRSANTGYGRAILRAISDLYGFGSLDAGTIGAIGEAMETRRKPGFYKWVLKRRSRIAFSIQDSDPDADPEFFVSVHRLDDFMTPGDRQAIEALEARSGVSIHGLEDLERAMETDLQRAVDRGIVGLKSGLAYVRPLEYRKRERRAAEAVLARILAGDAEYPRSGPMSLLPDDLAPLTDWMMRRMLDLAEDAGLPFQVHSGLQEGNANDIRNADPKLLIPLFAEYPRVRFDVFHSGYPFLSDLTAVAKNFPNVYVDMCWMHVISPTAARRALAEYLDTVPAGKILGFGGDYLFVEGVYGHQRIARANIATVLAGKVREGYFGMMEAREIAVRILQRNPIELFRIPRTVPPPEW